VEGLAGKKRGGEVKLRTESKEGETFDENVCEGRRTKGKTGKKKTEKGTSCRGEKGRARKSKKRCKETRRIVIQLGCGERGKKKRNPHLGYFKEKRNCPTDVGVGGGQKKNSNEWHLRVSGGNTSCGRVNALTGVKSNPRSGITGFGIVLGLQIMYTGYFSCRVATKG